MTPDQAVALAFDEAKLWAEYDNAAEWCARRGHTGEEGSPLPSLISHACYLEINADPEAFARRVREMAYGIAMEKNHYDNEVRGMMAIFPVDAGLAIGNILWANAIGFQHSEKG